MRIFVAGAAGVIGRRLVPQLLDAGHQVTGMTRTAGRADSLRRLGADAVTCDVFDEDALGPSVRAARPDVVINQLTAIPPRVNPRAVETAMAETSRLREEGTRRLMQAARRAGVRRVISQSIAFAYRPAGPPLAVEDEPLYLDAPASFRPVVAAVAACERTTTTEPGIEGVVLRYGFFYGPGTTYAGGGTFAEDVGRRRIPVIGSGAGVFSFVHVDDAARAAVLAADAPEPGIYNVVDDDPAPVREWLPYYAGLLGARSPLRIPAFVGRLGAGAYGMYLFTKQRGASNQAARERLGWQPAYPTWRDGLIEPKERGPR